MALLRAGVRMRGARRRRLLPAVLLLLCGLAAPPARAASSTEYQLKAVFLFNFAQFVEWPARAFPEADSPLVIGVLGDDPFGAALDQTVRGEVVNRRPLVVQRYRRVEEALGSHILFISHSESARLDQILASLRGRNILTVGESDAFALRGGMIRFLTANNKLRLRINMTAVQAGELTISSKLLRPSEIVSSERE